MVRRAMADVIGAVVAGVAHGLYGYIDWVAKQLFTKSAERESLIAEGAIYEVFPVPATYATGNVTITGSNGSSLLAGAVFRLDAATTYAVTTGGTIASGTATVAVTATTSGASGNLPAGATLTLESPAAGINSNATVAAGGLVGGVDEEGTEEFRARLAFRKRYPPQGGTAADYEGWALSAAGVEQAWVSPHEAGLGTVVVRVPSAGLVSATQAILDAERPITAQPITEATTAAPVALTIHIVPDNADTRAAVTAELADLFSRVAAPGNGSGTAKVLLSQIRTAIGTSEGVSDYLLSVPSADVVPAAGQLPTLGTITWV